MPNASTSAGASRPAILPAPATTPKPPTVAGRKNRIGERDAAPIVHATSTPSTVARDELPAAHRLPARAAPLGGGDERGEERRHRMHDRRLVHAVPFERVDLIGVDHRRRAGGQSPAIDPDRRFLAGAPARCGLDELAHARRARAARADAEGVQDERLRRFDRTRRQILVARARDELGEREDGIDHAPDQVFRGGDLISIATQSSSASLQCGTPRGCSQASPARAMNSRPSMTSRMLPLTR